MTDRRDPTRLLWTRDVCRVLNISRTTLGRWRREGAFPPPCVTVRNRRGWRAGIVDEWLQRRCMEAAE